MVGLQGDPDPADRGFISGRGVVSVSLTVLNRGLFTGTQER
jgi:hypothetical protein